MALLDLFKRSKRQDLQLRQYGNLDLTGGGAYNARTGMGTALDKSQYSFFIPTLIHTRSPLETLYVQSWAAKKFIDIPIDDMFIRWRTWVDDSDDINEQMTECEQKYQITQRLNQAMKASRAYGTSVVIIMTKEAPMDMPLIPEEILPGDLKALRVFDRFDLSVSQREGDMFDPNFGKPVFYRVHPTRGPTLPMDVHHSRVLRFDGISSPTDSLFYRYTEDWGVSEFIPVMLSLTEDHALASAIAHMSQEASIPALGISDLRDVIAGRAGQSEATVEQIGDAVNRFKSIYRLLLLDKDREEFSRVAIQFAGLADLMTKFAERLAAAADIPMTRWQGRSPAGMNATGESDMRNYVMMVEANRQNKLEPHLRLLDMILARNEGMEEVPEFKWNSLLELSDEDQAALSKTKAETLKIMLDAFVIDEDEAREALTGDPTFGELSGPAPEPPEPDPIALPGGPSPGPKPPTAKKPPAAKPPAPAKK